MTTIHFAGINTRPLAAVAEGHAILMSYADVIRSPGWWQREMLPRLERGAYPSVILDSGAFTVISQGIRIDVHEYASFAREHGALFDIVANLDDIAGDCEQSRRNLDILRRARVPAIPVFHQDEDWAELHAMSDEPRIGVGFARKPGGRLKYPDAVNRAWLDVFFQQTEVPTHGFAMTRLGMTHGYPFATTDSTTWIQEANALMRRNPGGEPVRPHGLGGDLATHFEAFDRRACQALTLRSYTPQGQTWPALRRHVEDESRGQARTVLRRLVQEAA